MQWKAQQVALFPGLPKFSQLLTQGSESKFTSREARRELTWRHFWSLRRWDFICVVILGRLSPMRCSLYGVICWKQPYVRFGYLQIDTNRKTMEMQRWRYCHLEHHACISLHVEKKLLSCKVECAVPTDFLFLTPRLMVLSFLHFLCSQ